MQLHYSILVLIVAACLGETLADYSDKKSIKACRAVNRKIKKELGARGGSWDYRMSPQNAFDDLKGFFNLDGLAGKGREAVEHLFALNRDDCTKENFEHAKASVECTEIDWHELGRCDGDPDDDCTPLQSVVSEMVYRRANNCHGEYMKEYEEMAKEADGDMTKLARALGESFKGKCDKGESLGWTRYLPDEIDYSECMEKNVELIREPILANYPGETDFAKLAKQAVDQCNSFIGKFGDLVERARWQFPIFSPLTTYSGRFVEVWRAFYACKALIAQPFDVIVYTVAVGKQADAAPMSNNASSS